MTKRSPLGPFHHCDYSYYPKKKQKKKISTFILLTKNIPLGSSSSSVPPGGDISALLEQKNTMKKDKDFWPKEAFQAAPLIHEVDDNDKDISNGSLHQKKQDLPIFK